MKFTRRLHACILSASMGWFLALLATASAAAYPEKPIKVVLGFAAGGGSDIFLRAIAPAIGEALGQQMVVENRPGAGGNLAMMAVAQSAPDGYTLLMGTPGLATNPSLYANLGFDPLRDFAPISLVGSVQNVLIVKPSLPVNSVAELVNYAKANPGKLNYGSPGSGSVGHLVAALFVARAGIDIMHVPYKGGGPAMTDLLGGQIPMLFGNSGEVMSNAKNDRIRIIAVSTAQRMKQLPNTPTVSELLPGFEMTAWQGTLAPARTPRPVIDVIANAIMALSKEANTIERLNEIGVESTTTTPEQMGAIIRGEQGVYAEAVKAAGLMRPQ